MKGGSSDSNSSMQILVGISVAMRCEARILVHVEKAVAAGATKDSTKVSPKREEGARRACSEGGMFLRCRAWLCVALSDIVKHFRNGPGPLTSTRLRYEAMAAIVGGDGPGGWRADGLGDED